MQSLSVCSAACEQPLHPNSDLAAVGVSLRPSLFRDPLVISGPLESIAESSSTILEQCYVGLLHKGRRADHNGPNKLNFMWTKTKIGGLEKNGS